MKQPLQILIVEDELLMAVAIEEALVGAGFGICGIARTYQDAIRLIACSTAQAAVVDINLAGSADTCLPELDGVATARALLRHTWMPLIYLTGNTDEATFERAKTTNPFAFLTKPLRPRELVQQVQLALHNFQQSEPIRAGATEEPVYLPTEKGYARVQQTEILYLQAAGNFTSVFLTAPATKRLIPEGKGEKPLILTGNLGYWGNHLSPRLFLRLSKSLIVNLTHIDRVEAHQITLAHCSAPLPLPGGTHKSLLNRLHVIRTR
ncbi:response regulator transcription factor [Fibrella aquatilis]|uniref:Response regulator transcription factor n=1 Tax=Fibrella aquatilis TaxID=2817059 RepID=A0A939G0W1_9BACT|nr:response regulator transcription factor [Fibrella aquatilis]MBO0929806.1 response regulator transcription factor [Fibrella aquatilis]